MSLTALLVDDYDDAIAFYVGALGSELRKDAEIAGIERWSCRRRRELRPACCWRVPSMIVSVARLSIRRAAGSYCF